MVEEAPPQEKLDEPIRNKQGPDLTPIWKREIQHPLVAEEVSHIDNPKPCKDCESGNCQYDSDILPDGSEDYLAHLAKKSKMNDTSILKSLMGKEDWNKTAEDLHPNNFDFGHSPTREHHEEAAKIVDGTHEHLKTSLEKVVEDSMQIPDIDISKIPNLDIPI